MNSPRLPSVLVLHGPNLNMLGTREPEIYGHDTLADLDLACQEKSASLGLACTCVQSNHEGVLIDQIQQARLVHDGIIFNPAGYTHSSVALLDAVRACGLPVIEVHLSNNHAREPFRRHSYISEAARGVICGFGKTGYMLALQAMHTILSTP